MKKWIFKKHSLKDFKIHILGLIIFEVLAIGGWCMFKPVRDHVDFGYVVKQGNHYLVYWKTDVKEQFVVEQSDLKSALKFAKDELELECATDRLAIYPLEVNWIKPSLGGFTFYWKTINTDFFNRLTFNSHDEAYLFQELVKSGAYSPSPIGHSLALFPKAKNSQ